mgnify:CR=1 FL=1
MSKNILKYRWSGLDNSKLGDDHLGAILAQEPSQDGRGRINPPAFGQVSKAFVLFLGKTWLDIRTGSARAS